MNAPRPAPAAAALPLRKKTVEIGKQWDGTHAIHRDATTYSERGMRAEHMSGFDIKLQAALLLGARR